MRKRYYPYRAGWVDQARPAVFGGDWDYDDTTTMFNAGLLFSATTFLAQTSGSGGAPVIPGAPAVQGTSQLLIWAIVLLGMAAAFFVAEVFVPSGGLLGACAALCLVGGIVLLFGFDTTVGLVGLIISLIAIPFALMLAIKVWPSTPIGRALTLGADDEADSAYDGQDVPPSLREKHPTAVPVGTLGKTLTELRPVGTCQFNGQRMECLSEAGVIEKGTEVKVISADGTQIKVRRQNPV